MNKAVVDATKITKVDVKKGTAARESKFTVDGSKIVIAMDAKLTGGAYNVTIEGLEATALTADVNVEKDETLTSFEIGDYLVAESVTVTSCGTIRYAALNQYGEKMTTGTVTPTCSFGKAEIKRQATATAEGEIYVSDISNVLAIVGQTGTIVLVGDMGVNQTKTISYNVAATATTAELIGAYHLNSASLKTITEGDTLSGYELLFSIKDQYGYEMYDDTLNKLEPNDKIQVTLAGGLTNITADTKPQFTARTLDGKDYVGVKLNANSTAKAMAGDATLNLVNPRKGLLLTTTISVPKNVVIKNIVVTADKGLYYKQENELSYEIVDADGKNVTSYAVLSSTQNGLTTLPDYVKLERNADGSAKMIYDLSDVNADAHQTGTDKAYNPIALTFGANSTTGGDYLVKTFQFNVYQSRYAKGVIGLKAGTVTSVAKKGKALKISSDKLILADQYSNSITSDEKAFNKVISGGAIEGTMNVSGTSVYVATRDAIEVAVVGNEIIATPAAVGTATVYLKYHYIDAEGNVTPVKGATATDYDARFSISVYDTSDVDVSTLQIKSVNKGFAVRPQDASGDALKAKLEVVANIGGSEVVIPADQYEITELKDNQFTTQEENSGLQTKTATVTVQVTTWDSTNTDIPTPASKTFEVSRAADKLYKVTAAVDAATSTSIDVSTDALEVTPGALVQLFKFQNQYGDDEAQGTAADDRSDITYSISLVSATGDKTVQHVVTNNQNSAKITFDAAVGEAGNLNTNYVYKITATGKDGSTKECRLTVNITKS